MTRVEIRHMRVFVAVAEEVSFRRAAARLRVAQPALSRTIQQLESLLKAPLLERTTRVVRLTEAGQSFLEYARSLLSQLDRAAESVRRISLGQQGEVSVGFNDFTISEILPPVIHRFRVLYPDVFVNLIDYSSPQMMELVGAGQLDVGFLSGVTPPPGLQSMVLRNEQLVCVLPTGHPLARRRRIPVRELANESFVLGIPAWGVYLDAVRAYCRTAGFTPRVVQTAVHSDGIINFVAAGIGVTLYIDREWLRRRHDVVVRPVTGGRWTFRSLAVWSAKPRSPCVEHLIGVMRDVLAAA